MLFKCDLFLLLGRLVFFYGTFHFGDYTMSSADIALFDETISFPKI